MRQARAGRRFHWKAMNRAPWEPTVCLLSVFSVLTHGAEQLKVCWMSERVTGPLYFGGRSRRISPLFWHWWSSARRESVIGRSCRWSRGPWLIEWGGGEHSTPQSEETRRVFSWEQDEIYPAGIWFSAASFQGLTSLLCRHFPSSRRARAVQRCAESVMMAYSLQERGNKIMGFFQLGRDLGGGGAERKHASVCRYLQWLI